MLSFKTIIVLQEHFVIFLDSFVERVLTIDGHRVVNVLGSWERLVKDCGVLVSGVHEAVILMVSHVEYSHLVHRSIFDEERGRHCFHIEGFFDPFVRLDVHVAETHCALVFVGENLHCLERHV